MKSLKLPIDECRTAHARRKIVWVVVFISALLLPMTASAEMKKLDLSGAVSAKGKAFANKSLEKQWVVVTYGASWCKPCKKELPAWDKLADPKRQAYKTKVAFVAVNVDSSRAKGAKFVAGLRLKNMRVLFDPKQKVVGRADPPKMPTTYIYDPSGALRYTHAGYHSGDAAKLDAKLKALTGTNPR